MDIAKCKGKRKTYNKKNFKNNVKEGKNISLSPSYFWTRGMKAKRATFRV
jgi:hypothetical protein